MQRNLAVSVSTLVTLVSALCAGGYWFDNHFASVGDVRAMMRPLKGTQGTIQARITSIRANLDAIEFDQKKNALIAQLHSTEAEMYSLKRIRKSTEFTARDARRLDQLSMRHGDLVRELNELDRRGER